MRQCYGVPNNKHVNIIFVRTPTSKVSSPISLVPNQPPAFSVPSMINKKRASTSKAVYTVQNEEEEEEGEESDDEEQQASSSKGSSSSKGQTRASTRIETANVIKRKPSSSRVGIVNGKVEAVELSGGRAKRYACTEPGCSKAYTRPGRLEEHTRSHTGEVRLSIVLPPFNSKSQCFFFFFFTSALVKLHGYTDTRSHLIYTLHFSPLRALSRSTVVVRSDHSNVLLVTQISVAKVISRRTYAVMLQRKINRVHVISAINDFGRIST